MDPSDISGYEIILPTGSPYTAGYNDQSLALVPSEFDGDPLRDRTLLEFEDQNELGITLGGSMYWNGTGGGHLYCESWDNDDYIYFYEPTHVTSFQMTMCPYASWCSGEGFHQDIYAYDADGNTVWSTTVDLSDYADWSNWLTVNVETANISTLHFIAPGNDPWYNGFWPSIDNMVINAMYYIL